MDFSDEAVKYLLSWWKEEGQVKFASCKNNAEKSNLWNVIAVKMSMVFGKR